jgi:hypothetical protein
MAFCSWCGRKDPERPRCPWCGHAGTTDTPPSENPCAYCGSHPTWPVDYCHDGQVDTLYLCPQCDELETGGLLDH